MVSVGCRHEPNCVCERVFLFADFWINALEVTLACEVRVCAPLQGSAPELAFPVGFTDRVANGVIRYVTVPAGLDKVSFWFDKHIYG